MTDTDGKSANKDGYYDRRKNIKERMSGSGPEIKVAVE